MIEHVERPLKWEKTYKKRSDAQNRSLHKFCDLFSEEARSAGYTMQVFSKFPFKIQPTPSMIKDCIRAIATAQTGKKSTADLTTIELQAAYEEFNLWLGEALGIHVPWPSIEEQLLMDEHGVNN